MQNLINDEEIIKTRIIIADDYPLIRQALRTCIEKEKDLEVVAETGDGQEAVELAIKLHPDVVIMDTEMPLLNGVEATRQIVERCHSTEVLVLASNDDTLHVLDIINSGASGYLTKSAHGEVIIHYIRKITAGEHAFPPSILYSSLKDVPRVSAPAQALPRGEELTNRELSILKMVARGMANKDIARKMGLSVHYIKASLTTIFIKLGVSSRTEAITNSLKAGIITLNELEHTVLENK